MNLKELGMDEKLAEQVQSFVRQIVNKFQPEAIILFGSYANKTFIRKVSDVDIIVISDYLSEKFLDRLAELARFAPASSRIEAIGYKSKEFNEMLLQGHPTAIDAIEFGVALYGDKSFNRYKEQLKELYKKGLMRRKYTFTLPSK